jgi:hypothetical protein
MDEKEGEICVLENPIIFEFPVHNTNGKSQMKNIITYVFPNLHGLSSEDPDTFLFEFDMLCHSYDYSSDAKKLKLFPTTLKDASLHFFVELGRNEISIP